MTGLSKWVSILACGLICTLYTVMVRCKTGGTLKYAKMVVVFVGVHYVCVNKTSCKHEKH